MKFLLLVSCIIVAGVVYAGNISTRANNRVSRITKRADENALNVDWTTLQGKVQLQGQLGLGLPSAVGQATDCTDAEADECYEYGDFAKLLVFKKDDYCTRFQWTSSQSRRLEDCFDLLEGAHWYGGGETYYQAWPIERESRREAPFVTGDSLAGEEYGSLVENYFLISTGISIHIDETVPLFISWRSVHDGKICFVAKSEFPYLPRDELHLNYDICSGNNMKEVHQKALTDRIVEKPTGTPDETMLIRPFWSTWAQYKTQVNQTIVLDFAKKIKEEGFELSSHVEIDDHWETCYGEAVFDPDKFPDAAAMVQELKAMDLRVTLWIHPFINLNCPSFMPTLQNGYFVKGQKDRTGITGWWQGQNSGIVDFTNDDAVNWWRGRLESLRTDIGIDSFKFDAGETNWLPYSRKLNGDSNLQPDLYTTKYVEAVSTFGGMIEVRSGRKNQNLPIFTRMLDKDSRWGYDNGLQSLIPTLLHFSIVGYPFVLPDMIGGNAYGEKPSRELFIRWMQANAFMPAVQFSIVPWDYDSEVIEITKAILAIREEYRNDIHATAEQAVLDGSPINRPIWWVDPIDEETFTVDNEYMLGDNILVAPVLVEGAVVRDIYLPAGTWMDQTGETHEGPIWLRDFPAPLDVLPYFRKQ